MNGRIHFIFRDNKGGAWRGDRLGLLIVPRSQAPFWINFGKKKNQIQSLDFHHVEILFNFVVWFLLLPKLVVLVPNLSDFTTKFIINLDLICIHLADISFEIKRCIQSNQAPCSVFGFKSLWDHPRCYPW